MPSVTTINYAAPPQRYFWHWSEEAELEWAISNDTLALRVEVVTLMKSLAEANCLPPFGTLLLVLAACGKRYSTHSSELQTWLIGSQSSEHLTAASEKLTNALDYNLSQIEALPENLRVGLQAKLNLLYVLFHQSEHLVPKESAELILHEMISEGEAPWHEFHCEHPPRGRFLSDAKCLLASLADTSTEDLIQLIETGVDFPLVPADSSTEIPSSEEAQLPLLLELEKSGGELRGLSDLAKQVIALVSLSRPSGQSEELPVGGVSDISNRGTPDRLLPSELAYDDLLLMSRLAQNEALYFQREHPPESAPLQRLVLIDHGLRFWGIPRLFGIATALGLCEHPDSRDELPPACYIADRQNYLPLPLQDGEQVKEALKLLPPHLDPARPLRNFVSQLELAPPEGVPDAFLISNGKNFANPEFRAAVSQLRQLLKELGGRLFLIALEREGRLQLSECLAGADRLINKGELDLSALIPKQTPPKKKVSQKRLLPKSPNLPDLEFYQHPVPPLLFGCRPSKYQLATHPQQSKAVGFSSRYLFEWDSPARGAKLLDYNLPGRDRTPHLTEDGKVFIVCSAEAPGEPCRLFTLDEDNRRIEIEIEKSTHSFPRDSFVAHGAVVLVYSDYAEAFCLSSGKRIQDLQFSTASSRIIYDGHHLKTYDGLDGVREHPFVTAIQEAEYPFQILSPTTLGFRRNGKLTIGGRGWSALFNSKGVVWREVPYDGSGKELFIATNNEASFRTQEVQLTSTLSAALDSRGFLHLSLMGTDGTDTWSLLLEAGQTSAWHPTHGLVTPSPRHLPPDASPRNSSRELNIFLSKLSNAR
ncbi:hypothetical protein AAFN60_11690 [Roseibacillus persicicus]|uniref:hypothetical protein n=1 Tax=Roseibacillus persicicus TaxID=454148 RepID=UPI00398B2467